MASACTNPLLATNRRIDPSYYTLLADPHIPADRLRQHNGVFMTTQLETVIKQVICQPRLPGGVIIAGDLAYSRAETEDYLQLANILQPLRSTGIAVHLALGNHDHRERFLHAIPWAFRPDRPRQDRCCTVVSSPHANWFLLDSLEETLSTPGLLGPKQLQWLASALDARRRKPAILVLHHHPDHTNPRAGLKDTEAFLEVLKPRPQVKACVFGHTHRWAHITDESGIHWINLPPTSYVFRPEYPIGWVEARVHTDGMILRLHCLDHRHTQHGQELHLTWRPARFSNFISSVSTDTEPKLPTPS
ncbi:MAG: metallophosphoesterase [Verrucomicrobiota bacterium]|nr:metallophosphoesterase [Limisphaera sp.]MDW8381875.1 metallophosphoesterase [Verrucomicrobiota bacterium]